MLSSSLHTILTLSKKTSPHKLFRSDCMTLYVCSVTSGLVVDEELADWQRIRIVKLNKQIQVEKDKNKTNLPFN